MATSSFSAPSRSSSGVIRVRCGCARSISMEVSRSRTPPATLKAPRVIPNTLKISVPATAKVVSTKKAAIDGAPRHVAPLFAADRRASSP